MNVVHVRSFVIGFTACAEVGPLAGRKAPRYGTLAWFDQKLPMFAAPAAEQLRALLQEHYHDRDGCLSILVYTGSGELISNRAP